MACEVRSWGFSPAEMERCSGFRMVFSEEGGGGLVVVVVVKDLEMGIVGNRKNCRVGVVVVVVVVLSSILRVSFLEGTRNDERRTTNDDGLCLPACLPLDDYSLRKKLILNKSQFTQDNLLGRDGVK